MSDEQLKKIQSDVDAMNKTFGMSVGVSDENETDPPSTDPPKTDAPTTDAPDDGDKTEPPKTNPPSTDAPTTDAPDDKDQVIAELRAKLAEKDQKPPEKNVPTTEPPLEIKEQDFLGDLDPADLTKEDFNKLLNKVFTQGIEYSIKTVRSSIPDTVGSLVEVREKMQKLNEQFYKDNEDLKPFQKVVATVFGELSAENPGKQLSDILKDTAPEVRKRLALPERKKQVKKPDEKGPPSKLPGSKGKTGRSSNDQQLTGIEAELAEMTKVIGR